MKKIKWEMVDDSWLCFERGEFSATVDISPNCEHAEDGYLYTVMWRANVLEEKFAGTLQQALISAEKVLKQAMPLDVKKWTLVHNMFLRQTRGSHNRFYIDFFIEPDGVGEYRWRVNDTARDKDVMGCCKTPLDAKKEAISAYKLLKKQGLRGMKQ